MRRWIVWSTAFSETGQGGIWDVIKASLGLAGGRYEGRLTLPHPLVEGCRCDPGRLPRGSPHEIVSLEDSCHNT